MCFSIRGWRTSRPSHMYVDRLSPGPLFRLFPEKRGPVFLSVFRNQAGPRVADWGTAGRNRTPSPSSFRTRPGRTKTLDTPRPKVLLRPTSPHVPAEGHASAHFSPRPGRRPCFGPLLPTPWLKDTLRPTINASLKCVHRKHSPTIQWPKDYTFKEYTELRRGRGR